MKKLLAILLVGACVAAGSDYQARPNDYVVWNNKGGNALEFSNKAKQLKAEGRRVVIDGECASACIMFLHSDYGLEYCATERARLGFHAAVEMVNGRISKKNIPATERVTRKVIAGLPPALQEAFAFEKLPSVYKGAKPSDLIWIKGKDAQKAIGACK